MRTYIQLYYLLSPDERRRGFIVIFLTLIMGLIDAFGAASILPFLGLLGNPEIVETNIFLAFLKKSSGISNYSDFIFFVGIIVFLIIFFSSIFKIISNYALLRFTGLREYSLGKRLLKLYLSQPYEWFLNKNSADISKNILSEINDVIRSGLMPLMNLISALVITLTMLSIMFLFTPKLALITLITFLSSYIIIYKFSKKFLLKLGDEKLKSNKERFNSINEVFGAVKQVKLSGLEHEYIKRFSSPSLKYASNTSFARMIGLLPRYILEVIAFGGMILAILYLMKMHGDINYALPSVGLFAYAGYRILPALQLIYQSVSSIKYSAPSVENLFNDFRDLLKYESQNKREIKIYPRYEINLKNIFFKYSDTNDYLLKNINLKIKANQATGFVGFTGSGKTTLIDIILGLLKPEKGRIIIDDLTLNNSNYSAWQESIGYVPQNIYLSDDTVASNIAFGFKKDNYNFNRIKKMAKLAQIDSFIENELPEGYQTIVGERGIRLSGGQRQRIGIARALYKKPKVLILDEATSALDNLTEEKLMKNIYSFNDKMTILIIAHRLSTVFNCNNICLLDKGKIIESGSFEELFNKSKLFREMNKSIIK